MSKGLSIYGIISIEIKNILQDGITFANFGFVHRRDVLVKSGHFKPIRPSELPPDPHWLVFLNKKPGNQVPYKEKRVFLFVYPRLPWQCRGYLCIIKACLCINLEKGKKKKKNSTDCSIQ